MKYYKWSTSFIESFIEYTPAALVMHLHKRASNENFEARKFAPKYIFSDVDDWVRRTTKENFFDCLESKQCFFDLPSIHRLIHHDVTISQTTDLQATTSCNISVPIKQTHLQSINGEFNTKMIRVLIFNV